ncbi:Protein transport protein Sec61 subunit gamma [Camellia lanceoleosa]|uniref:Protein transport protein Sec61 subunit gamma n=1 Tax=Camellia lanceoleosa TaxID=1840588 RepID=A0ACC0FC69_9ERIC|nr:Protein transport protein Sec61 subunit gamma [Camellia lanceoleosa]
MGCVLSTLSSAAAVVAAELSFVIADHRNQIHNQPHGPTSLSQNETQDPNEGPIARFGLVNFFSDSEESMDALDSVIDPLREFAKDSTRLVKRCHKPDQKEFTKVAFRVAIGFVVMGFVGFFVKLIFIPINNIIVGSA